MNKIAEKRKQIGVSQGYLSKACGWRGQSRIGNYEAGRTPSLSDCRKIIAALNNLGCDCSLDDVFPPQERGSTSLT